MGLSVRSNRRLLEVSTTLDVVDADVVPLAPTKSISSLISPDALIEVLRRVL